MRSILLKSTVLGAKVGGIRRVPKNNLTIAKLATVKLTLLGALFLGAISTAQADVKQIYSDSCAACHDSGALNAPKKGDKARWQALKQQKGMDTLVKSVKSGMVQMPAGGLCSSCSDQDYRALIEYMSQ